MYAIYMNIQCTHHDSNVTTQEFGLMPDGGCPTPDWLEELLADSKTIITKCIEGNAVAQSTIKTLL